MGIKMGIKIIGLTWDTDNWIKTKIRSVWTCRYSLDDSGRVDRIFRYLKFGLISQSLCTLKL